jgi:membrane protein involved in colicin uptake
VNGQVVNRYQPTENLNEVKRLEKQERLDEILRIREQERINEIKRHEELERLRKQEEERIKAEEEKRKLNETVNFHDVDCVTVEMFNRARFNSMMLVANKMIPH